MRRAVVMAVAVLVCGSAWAQRFAPVSPQFAVYAAVAVCPTPTPAPTPLPVVGPVRMEQAIEVYEKQCRSGQLVDVNTGTQWVAVQPGAPVWSGTVRWVANEAGQRWPLNAAAQWDQGAGGWSYSAFRIGSSGHAGDVPGKVGPSGVMVGQRGAALAQVDALVRQWWAAEANAP